MSFSEKAVRALPMGLMRGQLIGPASKVGDDTFDAVLERAIADRIDYLAVHTSDVERAALKSQGSNLPMIVWTVRSEDDLDRCKEHGAAVIFEHLDPELECRRQSAGHPQGPVPELGISRSSGKLWRRDPRHRMDPSAHSGERRK